MMIPKFHLVTKSERPPLSGPLSCGAPALKDLQVRFKSLLLFNGFFLTNGLCCKYSNYFYLVLYLMFALFNFVFYSKALCNFALKGAIWIFDKAYTKYLVHCKKQIVDTINSQFLSSQTNTYIFFRFIFYLSGCHWSPFIELSLKTDTSCIMKNITVK